MDDVVVDKVVDVKTVATVGKLRASEQHSIGQECAKSFRSVHEPSAAASNSHFIGISNNGTTPENWFRPAAMRVNSVNLAS